MPKVRFHFRRHYFLFFAVRAKRRLRETTSSTEETQERHLQEYQANKNPWRVQQTTIETPSHFAFCFFSVCAGFLLHEVGPFLEIV